MIKSIKTSKKLPIFFIFLVVFLIFFIIINISDIFSTLITKEKSIFYFDKIECPENLYFGVSISDFKREEDAKKFCNKIKCEGGLGEIIHSGEYFVLCHIYPTLLEAEEVRNNLINLNYNSRIVTIKVNEISFEYKGKEKSKITNAINSMKNAILEIYDITFDYDRNKIDDKEVLGSVAKILSSLTPTINNVKSINFDYSNKLVESLKKTKVILEEILFCNKKNLELSCFLKEKMLQMVKTSQDFSNFCKN